MTFRWHCGAWMRRLSKRVVQCEGCGLVRFT